MKLDKKIIGSSLLILVGVAVSIFVIAYFGLRKETAGTAVFYYSLTCPHCKTVEDYMDQNGTDEKAGITRKEVSLSKKNAEEFLIRMSGCGYRMEEAGVPMLWTEGTCTVGDQPIIDYFEQIDENK